MMKLKITRAGVHDAKGEPVPVGTVIEHEGETIPGALVNKCEVLGENSDGELVVATDVSYSAVSVGSGWWQVQDQDGNLIGTKMREAQADEFNEMSPEERVAAVAAQAAE